MFKQFIITLVLSLCLFPLLSQEGLRPLGGRISRQNELNEFKQRTTHNTSQKTQAVSLQIPFVDDFYYSSTSTFPDFHLWEDSSVYVNNGFAIAPPSIGVATFDGLNRVGYPYKPTTLNLTLSDSADKLTSKPIDLHVFAATSQTLHLSDSIALSFYYQARGNGETPEAIDSLLLDFYKPNQHRWVNVWGVPGNSNSNTNDSTFKRGFVWVTDTLHTSLHQGTGDTAYLADGFRFRFRNKATPAGDFDHWHLDYVYLNKNRSIFDTVFNDITFGGVPSSYLKNYAAMPYKQFFPSEMAAKNSVRIRNNSSGLVSMFYENRIFTYPAHAQIANYTGGSNIIAPFTSSGYATYNNHANPPLSYTFAQMNTLTNFEIEHYVYRSTGASSDFLITNDTVTQYQLFRNYFALDDGGAESGYYVNGQGGKMAIKVTLNVADTLEAVQIYFDPVGYGYGDTITYRFNLKVWPADGNGPSATPIYSDLTKNHARYEKSIWKYLPEYKLPAPVVLSAGTYYIGFQQLVAGGLAVGFDVNSDFHQSVYYDSGGGWTQSGFHGAPMIRPVFGKLAPVGIKENAVEANRSFLIYPNPSSEQFTIYSEHFENATYQLINAMGQKLQEEKIMQQQQQVNTTGLSDGIYFLIITNNNRLVQQQKIIIQH